VLFAETLDGPLVQNDPNERYKSPLRMNPRPMDGIYHATFVSARMYQAIHELQQRLGDEFEFGDILVNALAQNRQNFNEGYEVVMRDADLTEIGNHLIKGANDYMASAT
jgi:HEXXH motif-containing protein